ncbi:MAG: bifunctional adenosylcobinamide kinase/adenosylcobinamide-phosphate guanylyltransferase [Aminipila sp.]
MNVFISGGCKNGKSMYAQTIARDMSRTKDIELYYLATMRPVDEEDLARIARHIKEREGWGFTTIEQSEDICQCLTVESSDTDSGGKSVNPKGVFLLDSVTALLSNEMFRIDGSIDYEAPERVATELKKFAEHTGNTVFVSDYIYGDAAQYDALTEAYRSGLAFIDRTLAEICDRVIEVSFGNVIEYKEF